MTDDVPTWIAKTRPHTAADDGWAASEDGELALAAIHAATEADTETRRMRILIKHPSLVAAGAVIAAAAVVIGLIVSTPPAPPAPPPIRPAPAGAGSRPHDMALVSYDTCAQLLAGLRSHAARVVGPYGLPGRPSGGLVVAAQGPGPQLDTAIPSVNAAPAHSTTNVQEAGVDEPDIVKTDGTRIISITRGVLRVVDAERHKISGSLDLTLYSGWEGAKLLVSGDRALVALSGTTNPDYLGPPQPDTGTESTYLLVDLAGTPHVVSTFRAAGGYLDARMIGSTVRLVVSSGPNIRFGWEPNARKALAGNRQAIRRAPLSAWLPTYEVATGGASTKKTVPCSRVSHPAAYTGASMLTIYTVNLNDGFGDPNPVSVAADGDTVYATDASLYVASNPNWYWGPAVARQRTQLHRFDISGSGTPGYLGSGSVPGRLLSRYSLSDYHGYLRVAATTFGRRSATSVYVLDANTLQVTGQVGGLGRGEQVYAVRFLGPLGYVVTFRQVDPLYVIDLSNPTAPRTAGELTISGYSDYLHPVGDGRLVGVGQDATSQGRVNGLQVSLFDVSRPADPRRVDNVVRRTAVGEYRLDPHAFLYWPQSGLLVVPMQTWTGTDGGKALVLDVKSDTLTTVGVISHPSAAGGAGIERSLVIGDSLWTLSGGGLQASDARSLATQAWIPFS